MINRFRIDGIQSNEYQIIAISKYDGFIGAVYYDDFLNKIDVESKVGKISLNDSSIINQKVFKDLASALL